jgi:hypothetical protein
MSRADTTKADSYTSSTKQYSTFLVHLIYIVFCIICLQLNFIYSYFAQSIAGPYGKIGHFMEHFPLYILLH